MKKLSILRHAKTEQWLDINGDLVHSDFDRALTQQGHDDAVLVVEALLMLEPTIDLVISSTAVRARQTTEHIMAGLHDGNDVSPPLQWTKAIYGAGADTLLTTLVQLPAKINHVLLVGHNPGVTYLITGLLANSSNATDIDMPTAALAHLSLDINDWSQIRWRCGQLQSMIKPKLLRAK